MDSPRGLLMVAGAGLCWATTGLFGTLLFQEGVDPVSLASTRTALAALVFLLFLFLTNPQKLRVEKGQLLTLLPGSIIGVTFFNLFYMNAIDEMGISTAVVLLYTAPIFALLLSRIFLKESLTPQKMVALVLAFSGVILVVEGFELSALRENSRGIILGLGAGLSFGLLSVLGKASNRSNDPMTVSFYLLFLGALFLSFIRSPWTGVLESAASPLLLLVLGAMVFISTFLAHYLYLAGLSYLEAGKASIAVAIEPAVAILLAYVFLGEQLILLQYVGVVLILGAVFLLKTNPSTPSSWR